MNQMKRTMTGAFFATLMTIAMLMIAAPVSGPAVFASNQYVTDHIDAPKNLRFEGPCVCWDEPEYQYTYSDGRYDYYSNYDHGPNDEIHYTIEVYEVFPDAEPELLGTVTVDQESNRYDLTDYINEIQLVDDLGRENKLKVCIKAHLTGNEAPSLESETSCITSAPCLVIYMIDQKENDHFTRCAFEGWTAAEPDDPSEEGKVFLYWSKAQGERWDFSRKISPTDFDTTREVYLYAKWEDAGAHEHDGTVFLPWRSRNSLPNEAGSYYLLNDVDISGTWNAPQGNTNLCLNGYTVSSSGGNEQDPTIGVGGGATLNIYDGSDGAQGKLMMRNGGSAVGVNGGTFILNDATIDGTGKAKTNYGGGVEMSGGTFEMRSGKITNCSAGYGGGGVFVDDNGIFRMKGGEISSNRGGSSGGGIYMRGGKIEIIEGTITGNAASESGGGIEFYPVDGDDDSISLASDSAGEHKIIISGNSGGNLYLCRGYKVKIGGKLSDDSRIGVSILRQAEDIFTEGLNGNGTIGNFTSDHDGYKIALTEDGEEARFARNPHQIKATAAEHGSLKAYSDKTEITEAIAGESVRLWPQADIGYTFVRGSFRCSYTDAEGNEVTVPVDDYGDFTMPAYDVTVSCVFEETEIEDVRIATIDEDGDPVPVGDIEMGQTIQLVLVPYPETAEVKSVEWKSSDDGSHLTMTEDGKITGKINKDNPDDTETVTITATAKGKNGETFTESQDITVKHTHEWVHVHDPHEATCAEPGNSAPAQICENEFYPCYKTIPENVVVTPPLGHDWGEWTSLDAEQHQRVCKREYCSVTDTAEHSWDKGIITDPVSETAPRIKTYTCTVCKGTKTEELPSLLEEAKSKANDELDKVNLANYSGTERTNVENAIKAARKAIENAKSVNDVNTALTSAKNTIKAQKTNAQKEAAKKAEAKAKTVKTVTVNVPIVNARAVDKVVKAKGGSEKYVTKIVLGKKVKKIKAKAFAKYKKVTVLEVKTKKLKKATIKKSLKGSKVKTIKVRVGNKKVNKIYVKKYKKIFTKNNAGKKVKVKK